MKNIAYSLMYIGIACSMVWLVQASYAMGYTQGKGAAAGEIKLTESKHCYDWWFANDSRNHKLRLKQTKELLCKSKN